MAKKKKTKKQKDEERVDLDTRTYPNPWFSNYDYGGPEEGSEVGPGRGLYTGEFLEKARKRKHRKKALRELAYQIVMASIEND